MRKTMTMITESGNIEHFNRLAVLGQTFGITFMYGGGGHLALKPKDEYDTMVFFCRKSTLIDHTSILGDLTATTIEKNKELAEYISKKAFEVEGEISLDYYIQKTPTL